MKQALKIAITTGEPAGVGPELTVQALAQGLLNQRNAWSDIYFTVLGDQSLLSERAVAVGVEWAQLIATKQIALQHHALAAPSDAGQLNPANGRYVLALLDAAIDGALADKFDAIVTAPVQKSVINQAALPNDPPFTGHTEYLAQRTGAARVVMMLAGPDKLSQRVLRVALATTHIPLQEVTSALTIKGLVDTLRVLDQDLRSRFNIITPRILVAGLNPHAGENGYLGRTEIDIIIPAIHQACQLGVDACGPYPADTLFQPHYLDGADCVLAMYHDQGLPVLKYATFGRACNITLGLPIVRTSVDHGTALTLAGTGQADPGSLLEAINVAITLARHQ